MAPRPADADVAARLHDAAATLTRAERAVAHVVGTDPELVAFGTVAEVATAAGSSGATVVRLCAKLGYRGFVELQGAVQAEMGARLRPAAERIRGLARDDVVAATLAASLTAISRTFDAVDHAAFERAVALAADDQQHLWLVAGDAGAGLVAHAGDELAALRRGVSVVSGNPVAVGRQLAALGTGDVLVALDVRRYDRWVLDAVELARSRGAVLVALTDSPVSPLAAHATEVFVIEADGSGPFDNYAGALSLLTALVTGVAQRRRRSATRSLDQIEAAWRGVDALSE